MINSEFPNNKGFARSYLQLLLGRVDVGDKEVKISGPKSALAEQVIAYDAAGKLVPTFDRN